MRSLLVIAYVAPAVLGFSGTSYGVSGDPGWLAAAIFAGFLWVRVSIPIALFDLVERRSEDRSLRHPGLGK